jgi:hypothetical protein
MKITINKKDRLYVFNHEKYVTCLGFSVCKERAIRLNNELGKPVKLARLGSMKLYNQYGELHEIAEKKNRETGWRANCELNPALTPYFQNRQRVEVDFGYEKKRGTIGKTTGFVPCYLLMLTTRSMGSSYTIGMNDKITRVIG